MRRCFSRQSGGNEFRGTYFGGYSPEKWQAHNIDADQIARGLQGGGGIDAHDVNRLSSYQDTNIGFGGYAIKTGCGGTDRTGTRT